jgi:cellulose synthase/poly-beta-1,6-N-acetylglucosamine synthase-like glycosyltransferase
MWCGVPPGVVDPLCRTYGATLRDMDRTVGEGRLLVLVPAWNEESSVGGVVKEVLTALPEVDVLVVDDGSTDRTAEIAAGAGARVLSLPYNLGVGGAMRAGYATPSAGATTSGCKSTGMVSTTRRRSRSCWAG